MVGTAMNRLTRTPSVWLIGLTRELHTCCRNRISPVCVSTTQQYSCIISHVLCVTRSNDQGTPHLSENRGWPGNSRPVAEIESVQSVYLLHSTVYYQPVWLTVMTRKLHTCRRIRISPVCVSTTHQYSVLSASLTHSVDQGTPHLSQNQSSLCIYYTSVQLYYQPVWLTVMTRELHTCCRIRISPVCVSTSTTHQYSSIVSNVLCVNQGIDQTSAVS